MALIKFSECGKEISNLAKVCPNCGAPLSDMLKIPVYLKRKKQFKGSAIAAKVLINGQMVGTLDSGTEFSIGLEPGSYQISLNYQFRDQNLPKLTTTTLNIPSNAKSAELEVAVKESLLKGVEMIFDEVVVH